MVTPFQPCAPGLTAQLETGPPAAPTVAPVPARPAVRPHIVIVRARQRRFPCDQVAAQIGGSACALGLVFGPRSVISLRKSAVRPVARRPLPAEEAVPERASPGASPVVWLVIEATI